ncbi:proteophosphoglycan ppg4 [Rhodotorula toruloides]|uniref:Small ribosomal subunit protein mS38 n=1 Tax=Rhodotorula toruloides TaxID=5286 RepID=A0A511K9R3_RHOTO|nr:proteophosphoglycan ppg4 [Rhodotorula toruloides]
MPVRVPRLAAPSRPAKASFSRPSYRTLPRPSVAAGRAGPQASAAGTSSRCTYSSSSSAGRSSSRDGTPRVKQAPATAPRAASPTPAPLKQTKVALAQPDKLPAASSMKHAFELPHVGRGLVGLDSFFALHRPLLELPLRPGTRRSAATQETDSDYVPLQDEVDEVRMSRKGESELALVQDRADDGSLVGEPYFARLKQVEPLKSVEEELAAEAEEDAILAYKEEVQHQAEQQAAEPYDAWLVGQHERLEPTVARYLATRPPHTEPSSPTASSSDPSSTRPEFAYLAPFNSSSTPDVKAETSFSHIFSPLFLSPLTPDESTRTADSFLRTCEMAYRWSARNDFISTIGERLRQASQAYGVAEAAKAAPASEEAVNERGAIRVWDEQEGYRQVQAALGTHSNLFLPQEIVDLGEVTIEMDSVKRKRQKKIRKHKYKKRRKAQRALRKKLGK